MRFKWFKKIFRRDAAVRCHVDARGPDTAAGRRIEAALRESERCTLARLRSENDRTTADAFNVAARIPAGRLLAIRTEIDRLVESGASFHEARPALERLVADIQEVLRESP